MLPSVTASFRSVAPVADVITLAQAKEHCRISHDDEDLYISSLIAAAVSYVDGDGLLGRAMITQTWVQWVPQSPGWVRLAMGPFQALVSVEYYNAAGDLLAADLADFETRLSGDHVICKPRENAEWPNADDRADAIKITYRVGFGDDADDVPAGIRHALLMLVSHWYENREAVIVGTGAINTPMAFDMLINRERVGWYG